MGVESFLFYTFAALAVVSALAMVMLVRNVVAGAMSLVGTMISLAGIYALLEAHLVAAIQIMVYAGAILVLFLFVIMLLNLRSDDFAPSTLASHLARGFGALAGVGALAFAVTLLPGAVPPIGELPEGFGGYRDVGIQLFVDYVVAVETAGLLLLAAIVGAVILAKKRID
ncbi:MAG: NADH-quinone oxidoreductase subunit J [Proteobacteria bacterium]|nr:NADH-quinone oxidoreductase subunit J [Pseudomonadota bacterium]